jgi:NAD-dependent DNA ligase
VSASTDMLVCGANVGASKTAKAEKLGVQIVDQDEDLAPTDRRRRGLTWG